MLQSAIEHTKSILKTEKQHLRDLEDAVSYSRQKKRMFLDIVARSDTLLDVLHGNDIQAVIELLHSLIKRIDVFGSEKANITYRFSLTDRGEPNASERDGFSH